LAHVVVIFSLPGGLNIAHNEGGCVGGDSRINENDRVSRKRFEYHGIPLFFHYFFFVLYILQTYNDTTASE